MKSRNASRAVRFLAMLLAVAAYPAFAAAQGFRSPERVDTTLTLDHGGTLSVSVYAGRVNVVGAPGGGVRIRGTAERGDLDIRSRPSSISVSTEPEGSYGGRAELDITVPVGTRVILEGFSAPFSVRGVKGAAKIENLSGSVQVTDAVGSVSIETVSGDISARGVDGDVRAEAVSGQLDLSDVDGDIEAESVSGRVVMTHAKSRTVRVETVDGSITYGGTFDPVGNYTFKSHSGRLTLGLPADAGATVSLETFSGNVDSDFPVTLESSRSRRGHESRFEFRIGNGRTRIVTETFSGDIRIQRSTNSDNRER